MSLTEASNAVKRRNVPQLTLWPGLAWLGLAWLGLAWLGLARLGPAWPGLDRLGPAWPGLDRLGLAWLGPPVILHPPAYEDGTDRVFRNDGI